MESDTVFLKYESFITWTNGNSFAVHFVLLRHEKHLETLI